MYARVLLQFPPNPSVANQYHHSPSLLPDNHFQRRVPVAVLAAAVDGSDVGVAAAVAVAVAVRGSSAVAGSRGGRGRTERLMAAEAEHLGKSSASVAGRQSTVDAVVVGATVE